MISLVNYIVESKTLHQNVNITENKTLHQNVNIAEKLIINKYFDINKSPGSADDLKNGGWKKVDLNDVDPKYADVDIDDTKCARRLYNKDGSPTNWFAWWMILCIYGPMNKKELLQYCGLKETSYSITWADMSGYNIIKYNSKTRKSEPIPMSQWTIWK